MSIKIIQDPYNKHMVIRETPTVIALVKEIDQSQLYKCKMSLSCVPSGFWKPVDPRGPRGAQGSEGPVGCSGTRFCKCPGCVSLPIIAVEDHNTLFTLVCFTNKNPGLLANKEIFNVTSGPSGPIPPITVCRYSKLLSSTETTVLQTPKALTVEVFQAHRKLNPHTTMDRFIRDSSDEVNLCYVDEHIVPKDLDTTSYITGYLEAKGNPFHTIRIDVEENRRNGYKFTFQMLVSDIKKNTQSIKELFEKLVDFDIRLDQQA